MYVRWKVLIGLGVVFWMLLCLTDYYWLREIDFRHKIIDEIQAHTEPLVTDVPPVMEESYSNVNIIFWNMVAFVSTISVCFTVKTISKKLNLFSTCDTQAVPIAKKSSSKIPVAVTSKSSIDISSSQTNTCDESKQECSSCTYIINNSRGPEDEKCTNDDKPDKKIWSIRNMEKHCSKLREEMINLQASSLKEHASVTKKMDTLGREKRELLRQVSLMQKENKNMKQQVEEMLNERTLLIKRLDCATKEIKSNTKAKRMTMVKLDEAVANAERFKTDLEQITRDKVILEDKLTILDAEYKRLKEEVSLFKDEINCSPEKDDSNETMIVEDNKEHVIDKYDFSDDNKNVEDTEQIEESDFYISQSEQDIKKVQQKLMTLEKSLENFKFRQTDRKECLTTTSDSAKSDTVAETLYLFQDGNIISVEDEPSTNSICTEPGCPLEHRECANPECFLKLNQQSKTDESINLSSGDDSFTKFTDFSPVITNLAKRTQKYLRSTISDDRLSVISERVTTTGEDSGEEPTRRFVSSSPAFKKFLRNVLTSGDQPTYNMESTS